MGKEAACEAVAGKASGPVKAHLDSERVRLTGTVRLDVALADVRDLAVRGDALEFLAGGERVSLALGAKVAAAWAKAIAHPKTLVEKLDVRPGYRVCVLGFEKTFASEIAVVTGAEPVTALRGSFDIIFCAIDDARDLEHIARWKKHLQPAGALWFIYPKGKAAPVHESAVRQAFLDAGLVDTKVASFSATHTAVKVVIPVSARAR